MVAVLEGGFFSSSRRGNNYHKIESVQNPVASEIQLSLHRREGSLLWIHARFNLLLL